MGKAPAVIIIVRHGARLDAVDKSWHLSSPTPYDPPLTYGGWTQCRALGARIAEILQRREATFDLEQQQRVTINQSSKGSLSRGRSKSPIRRNLPKRKKHKVVLHSSPFLRCVQTSVAIGAGIGQFHSMYHDIQAALPPEPAKHRSREVYHSTEQNGSRTNTQLQTIEDEDEETPRSSAISVSNPKPFRKLQLRLDAYLGEWLSPEYYESITPPPDSVLMLASAKAELLRKAEHIDSPEEPSKLASRKGYFPGGWGSPEVAPSSSTELKETKVPSLTLSNPSLKSPARDRASTQDSMLAHRSLHNIGSESPSGGYTAPTPRYAILPLDAIPEGYVAHARNACIEPDISWDSTRSPNDWGDGGKYGEEWSSMHRRFRTGLHKMVNWYRLHHDSAVQTGGHLRIRHPHPHDDDDEDTDTVLILVTHGAGCNALIGALTDQPALVDVGMASLTMAVHKDVLEENNDEKGKGKGKGHVYSRSEDRNLLDRPLSTEYSLIITASVDHLRAGTTSLQIPLLQQPSMKLALSTPTQRRSSQPQIPRPRYRITNSSMVTSSPIDTRPELPNPAGSQRYGALQRSASAATAPRSRSGLWNVAEDPQTRRNSAAPGSMPMVPKTGEMVQPKDENEITESDLTDDSKAKDQVHGTNQTATLHSAGKRQPQVTSDQASGEALSDRQGNVDLPSSGPGLWSAPASRASSMLWQPPGSEVGERSGGVKRRWTVNERQ